MKRPYILLLATLLLHGCIANDTLGTDAAAQINIQHLSRLNLGMHQPEVLCIMRKPYSQQTFEFDGATFDVWFYVTKPTVLGQSRMVPANLTPLTFKNGELIGWGFSYYNYLLKRQRAAEKMLQNVSPTFQQAVEPKEDIELEKSLKNLPKTQQNQTGPQQPKPPQQGPSQPTQPSKKPPQPAHGKSGPNQPAGQPPGQQTPNWGPIDRSQPQAPPQQGSSGKTVSMSAKPKANEKTPSQSKTTPPPKEKEPLLDEEDRKMLEEESEQNFNQN